MSGTSGNEHGRDADLLCRALRDPSSFRGTRDGDTRHGRGWDAKLTVCCPPVQGFDDRRVRMHNALRAGDGVLHGNTLLLAYAPPYVITFNRFSDAEWYGERWASYH